MAGDRLGHLGSTGGLDPVARLFSTLPPLWRGPIIGPGIARQGNQVKGGGVVTSGTMSPCLGIGIGMAYVPVATAEPGTPIEIDVRGKLRAAEMATKPLYSKER